MDGEISGLSTLTESPEYLPVVLKAMESLFILDFHSEKAEQLWVT